MNYTINHKGVEAWLLLNFFLCLRNTFYCHMLNKEYRCLNKMIHQTDRKWMVAPSVPFVANIELVFVLAQESGFS